MTVEAKLPRKKGLLGIKLSREWDRERIQLTEKQDEFLTAQLGILTELGQAFQIDLGLGALAQGN